MDKRISLLAGQIMRESLTRALLAMTTPMSSSIRFYTENYGDLPLQYHWAKNTDDMRSSNFYGNFNIL